MMLSTLPSPIAYKWFRMKQCASGLRPDFPQALGHLIDLTEVFTQLGCSITLAALSRSTITPSSELAAAARTYVDAPLNLGHFLQAWKLSASLLLHADREIDRPFRSCAAFIDSKTAERHEVLATLDAVPELRNRKKGHTFVLPDSVAQTVYEEWMPKLQQLLEAAAFISRELRLCVVTDVADADLLEVAAIVDNRTVDQAEHFVVSAPGRPNRDSLLVLPAAALSSGSIETDSFLAVDPFMYYKNGAIYFYQGKRGKRAVYQTVIAADEERADLLDTLKRRLAPLIATTNDVTVKPPKWADALQHHTLLCAASFGSRPPNPQGFYRGAPVTWADLQAGLAVPCDVRHGTANLGPDDCFAKIIIPAIERARRLELPVVTFVGHAGSGKTTQLFRVGYELFRALGEHVCVLRRHIGSPLSIDDYRLASSNSPNAVICVLADEAHEIQPSLRASLINAAHERLPLAVFCAERSNLWSSDGGDDLHVQPLTRQSIEALLTHLGDHNMLGVLAQLPLEKRVEIVLEKLDRQILVALREATEGKRFDEILLDEYKRIPSDQAKRVYFAACMLQAAGTWLPEKVGWLLAGAGTRREAAYQILAPCKDVLHLARGVNGHIYAARHRIIAEVVARHVSQDPSDLQDRVSEVAVALTSVKADNPCGYLDICAKALSSDLIVESILAANDFELLIEGLQGIRPHRPRLIGLLLAESRTRAAVLRLCCRLYLDMTVSERKRMRRGAVGLARALYRAKLTSEADAVCQDAIEMSAEADLRLFDWLTTSLERRGQTQEVLGLLRRAVQMRVSGRTSHLDRYCRIVAIESARANIEAAVEACHLGISHMRERKLDGHRLFHQLAGLLERQQNLDGAIAACKAGIEQVERLNRKNLSLFIRLSELFEARGVLETAAQACRGGLDKMQSSPVNSDSLYLRLSAVEEKRGDLEQAITVCRQGLETLRRFGTGHPALYIRVSQVEALRGDSDAAVKACVEGAEQISKAGGDCSMIYCRLALLEAERGNLDRAAEICREGIEHSKAFGSGSVELYWRMSHVHQQCGNLEAAISACHEGIDHCQTVPGGDHSLYSRASVLYELCGNRDQAIAVCENGIERLRSVGGLSASLFHRISVLEERRGNLQAAIAVCHKGIEEGVWDRDILLNRLARIPKTTES